MYPLPGEAVLIELCACIIFGEVFATLVVRRAEIGYQSATLL